MPGTDDRGLNLSLPWGRPSPGGSRQPEPREAPGPPGVGTAAAPEPAKAPVGGEPTQTESRPARPPDTHDSANLARIEGRLQQFARVILGRLDALQEQGHTREVALERRLAELDAQLQNAQKSYKAMAVIVDQLLSRLEGARAGARGPADENARTEERGRAG